MLPKVHDRFFMRVFIYMVVEHSFVYTFFFFPIISHLNLSVNFWCFVCIAQNLVGRM